MAIEEEESGLTRIRAKLEQPLKCPACGSEWFTEITYHRYSASAYGTCNSRASRRWNSRSGYASAVDPTNTRSR
jgi:hypothetical protein